MNYTFKFYNLNNKNRIVLITIISALIFFSTFESYSQFNCIDVSTDRDNYQIGNIIYISGEVCKRLSGTPVTLIITSPNNNIISIDQITLPLGYTQNIPFETTTTSGGPLWKLIGEYTVNVTYGANKATTSFNLVTTDFDQQKSYITNYTEKIIAGRTITWTSDPGSVADDSVDLHVWYEISGQVASWVSPQKLDFGVASAGEDFPTRSWTISVPKNTSSGVYYFEWIEQCVTAKTRDLCVEHEILKFRIDVVGISPPSDAFPVILVVIVIIAVIGVGIGIARSKRNKKLPGDTHPQPDGKKSNGSKPKDITRFWACPVCGADPQVKDGRQYCSNCNKYL